MSPAANSNLREDVNSIKTSKLSFDRDARAPRSVPRVPPFPPPPSVVISISIPSSWPGNQMKTQVFPFFLLQVLIISIVDCSACMSYSPTVINNLEKRKKTATDTENDGLYLI